jgi:hypothetical protein
MKMKKTLKKVKAPKIPKTPKGHAMPEWMKGKKKAKGY